jgi:hypothetical protein
MYGLTRHLGYGRRPTKEGVAMPMRSIVTRVARPAPPCLRLYHLA